MMESYDTIIDMENLHSLGGQFVIVVLALCLLVLGLIIVLLVASDLARLRKHEVKNLRKFGHEPPANKAATLKLMDRVFLWILALLYFICF